MQQLLIRMFKQSLHQKFIKCANDNFNVQDRFNANYKDDSTKLIDSSNSLSYSLLLRSISISSMISIKQIYIENSIMILKFTFCQRFQSLKNYIDIELRDIVIAFLEKIEYMINEIISLTFYIKNNLKYDDFNVVAQQRWSLK